MYRSLIKRSLDFIISLFLLLFLLHLLLLIIFSLFCTNGKSGVFFYQLRPGINEKIFKLIKFKTMSDERDVEGNLLPDVDRLTKVGRFVRSTSLDELPQLINVLKGDMSLIGPRPLLVRYLPYYTERERLRHSVRPGITGWSQVHGRNALPWDKRLESDVWYVEHLSFCLDLKIALLTIKKVLFRENIISGENPIMDDLDKERSMK